MESVIVSKIIVYTRGGKPAPGLPEQDPALGVGSQINLKHVQHVFNGFVLFSFLMISGLRPLVCIFPRRAFFNGNFENYYYKEHRGVYYSL